MIPEKILKYIGVIISSGLKFVAGPALGPIEGLSTIETIACTVIGMMISVFIVVFVGGRLRQKYLARQKNLGKYILFTQRNRRLVRIWQKFGINGIAILTPILLTPIGGSFVAIAFGVRRRLIIYKMFLSALFWGSIITLLFEHIKQLFIGLF